MARGIVERAQTEDQSVAAVYGARSLSTTASRYRISPGRSSRPGSLQPIFINQHRRFCLAEAQGVGDDFQVGGHRRSRRGWWAHAAPGAPEQRFERLGKNFVIVAFGGEQAPLSC